jgi:hypothetical protein
MDLYRILAVIAVVTFVIYAAFNIIYLIDLRKTSVALRRFINRTDENLIPALDELRSTLQDLRKVTSDVSSLTERMRSAAGAILTVERTIEHLYSYYREGLGQSAHVNMAAIKAGLRVGVANLFRNLRSKKEGSA